MAKSYNFPRTVFDLEDRSMTTVTPVNELSLQRPIFFGFGEQGVLDVPTYGDITALRKEYGDSTFNIGSDYFTHGNLFATECLKYNPIFFVRVADQNAKEGSLVIVVKVFVDDNKTYLKYDRMSIEDVRTATGDNTLRYDNLTPVTWDVTETIGGVVVEGTAYPLIGATFGSPGRIANQSGIVFFYDDTFGSDREDEMGTVIYQIGYVQKPIGSDNTLPIRNTFQNAYNAFSVKAGVVDPLTTKSYSFSEVMRDAFRDTFEPPYPTVIYSDNFKTIGEIIISNEPLFPDKVKNNPYLVNILTAKDLDGVAYANTIILESDTELYEDNNQWFIGGSDGDLSRETYEDLVATWLTGEVYPEIVDIARYPITHLYDSGYTIGTKNKMIDFLGIRKEPKVTMATHVSGPVAFSKEEDQSMAASLRNRMMLNIESTLYGTGACRGEIIQHSGILPDSQWTDRIALTWELMKKRADAHNATFIKRVPKGLPWSKVDSLVKINWTASADDHKQLSWDTAANYCQYYNKDEIHFPDIRSVYQYSNSVLSSSFVVDYLIYARYICNETWAEFAGSELPPSEIQAKLKRRLDSRFNAAFGQFISMTATPVMLTRDIENGDSITVQIEVRANSTFRTMFVHSYVVRNVA